MCIAVLSALALGSSVFASAHDKDDKHGGNNNDRIVFTVDIAEDAALFNPTFVKPTDTQPERGSFFITEGNIYPGGTIQGDGSTFDPNKKGALGRWFCRGTHLVSATKVRTAARRVTDA